MKIYKNKKILVTGGSGFIGSHFVKKLIDLGAKVTVTVKYNSVIDYPRLISVKNKNIDVISTTELCKEAMHFAKDILRDNGIFVCKP